MIRLVRRFVFNAACLYRVHSRTPASIVVIVRSGRYVETVETSEHRPFCRSHDGSFANRLGVDAKRNSDRIRREESGGEPDQPGQSFLVIALDW